VGKRAPEGSVLLIGSAFPTNAYLQCRQSCHSFLLMNLCNAKFIVYLQYNIFVWSDAFLDIRIICLTDYGLHWHASIFVYGLVFPVDVLFKLWEVFSQSFLLMNLLIYCWISELKSVHI